VSANLRDMWLLRAGGRARCGRGLRNAWHSHRRRFWPAAQSSAHDSPRHSARTEDPLRV